MKDFKNDSDNSSEQLSAPAYAKAGVNLDHDEQFVSRVRQIARSTFRPEVLTPIGGFAGLFKAPERYKEPVFVASTDGVGTKLKLASQLSRFDVAGIDCVAMVVNDIVVQGAEPVVFLDYLALGEQNDEIAEQALLGIAEGCRRAGCAILGGETATMPSFYGTGELELVGFGVGVVERSRVIDGTAIRPGNAIIGLASNGLHSNGFSLVRSILETSSASGRFDMKSTPPELNTSIASAVMAPTRIYVKPIQNLLRDFEVNGIVHVTGGGFAGNLPRILPSGVAAQIDANSWPRPPIFDFLAKEGEISRTEMMRVFNCGIGMILIVSEEDSKEIIERLTGMGERAHLIGKIGYRAKKTLPVLYGNSLD